jgi:hypothetical protein
MAAPLPIGSAEWAKCACFQEMGAYGTECLRQSSGKPGHFVLHGLDLSGEPVG